MIDLTSLANDIAALDAERLKQIGQIQTFAATALPEGWMICDGSSVLFSDWPEFQQVYNEGRFAGMTLSSVDPAQVGKLVLNGAVGVYLPDLEGLFMQASSTGTAGQYLAAGLPNITGYFGWSSWHAFNFANGAFSGTPATNELSIAYTETTQEQLAYSSAQFSAAKSNSIYGASSTVQPPAVKYVMAMYLGKST